MMSTKECPQLDYQRVAAFKIWYPDKVIRGVTYQDWCGAPDDNVQVVMLYFEKRDGLGRYTRLYSSGCTHYLMTPDMKLVSSFEDVPEEKGHLKFGRFMNYEKLLELEKQAFEDFDNA